MRLVSLLLMSALVHAEGVPVVAELFTSEGCSSCPPADLLLEHIRSTQPFKGAQVIVLSEHVDYWNGLGWEDPFSSAQFSERQRKYARRFQLDGPYTPQLVIDGSTEFVGSDSRAASAATAKAITRPKTAVTVSAMRQGSRAEVTVTVAAGSPRADLWIAIAGDRYTSSVRRGENSGRTLAHVSVVHVLTNAGRVEAGGGTKTLHIPIDGKWTRDLHAIAFLQAPDQGPIYGAGSATISGK